MGFSLCSLRTSAAVPVVTDACTVDGLFREESGMGRAGTLGNAAVPSLRHTSALLGPLASDPEVARPGRFPWPGGF